MQILNSLHAHHALPGPKGREHDKSTIRLGDLADLIHPAEQDTVNLGGRDGYVLDEESDTSKELMDPELSLLDGLRSLAGDQNFGGIPTLGVGWTVAITPGEGRREVDGRVGHGFDELDVLAVTATQELVHGGVKRGGIDNSPELHPRLAHNNALLVSDRSWAGAYKLVNVDEHARLGVLG